MGLLESLGGEAGCRRLAESFYGRVGADPVLRPLFPGKSMRCAIEEFSAFLVQFLGGDETATQKRWWLSLRESHARFKIGPAERKAWLELMMATVAAEPVNEETREGLRELFTQGVRYLAGGDADGRWTGQRELDEAVAAIVDGRDEEVVARVEAFAGRPAVFVGLLARMMRTGRVALIRFVEAAVEREPGLGVESFGGRPLLHYAAAAGCVEVVTVVLRLGGDPGLMDRGGHTALYAVANGCAAATGPEIVRLMVGAGADVNACDGVMRATPLHMAARRGFTGIAEALLDCGAAIEARDKNGVTPFGRAVRCRKQGVAELLAARGARSW